MLRVGVFGDNLGCRIPLGLGGGVELKGRCEMLMAEEERCGIEMAAVVWIFHANTRKYHTTRHDSLSSRIAARVLLPELVYSALACR